MTILGIPRACVVDGRVTVDANGASYDQTTAGDPFTVRVEADVAGNIVGPLWFTTIPRVDAEIVGRKQ